MATSTAARRSGSTGSTAASCSLTREVHRECEEIRGLDRRTRASRVAVQGGRRYRCGIDVTKAGWADEYDRLLAEDDALFFAELGTPHVEPVIAAMEQQFSEGGRDA